MAPLLLYIPPLLEMETLTMQSVAGLTIVQGLAGCLSGSLIHKKLRFVSNELSLYMGSTIFLFAAIGGAGSRFVSNSILLFIFACLAFTASIFMLLPIPDDSDRPDVAVVKFSRFRALTTASAVGLLGGLLDKADLSS